jgi:KaiC/GvpD/RAD55 family RecA-like ATPase
MDRVQTGIKGLDELIEGGFPKGSTILLAGGTGTCKTIFSMQYIYNGAIQFNEPGLFVTIESNAKNITWNMQSFGWDIRPLQEKRMVNIQRLHLGRKKHFQDLIKDELATITSLVKELGIQRLVIDSTTAFAALIEDPATIRSMLFKFTDGLKELDCTTVLTSETKNEKNTFSAFGVEEFMADGVIVLYFIPPNRSIFIRKMRGTRHSKNIHPFEITQNGIVVKPKEQILWEAIK